MVRTFSNYLGQKFVGHELFVKRLANDAGGVQVIAVDGDDVQLVGFGELLFRKQREFVDAIVVQRAEEDTVLRADETEIEQAIGYPFARSISGDVINHDG